MSGLRRYIFGEKLYEREKRQSNIFLGKNKAINVINNFYDIDLEDIAVPENGLSPEDIIIHVSELPIFTIYTFKREDVLDPEVNKIFSSLTEDLFEKLQKEGKIIKTEEGNLIDLKIMTKESYIDFLESLNTAYLFFNSDQKILSVEEALELYIHIIKLRYKLYGGEEKLAFIDLYSKEKYKIFGIEKED